MLRRVWARDKIFELQAQNARSIVQSNAGEGMECDEALGKANWDRPSVDAFNVNVYWV
jgi:hypothetical protein